MSRSQFLSSLTSAIPGGIGAPCEVEPVAAGFRRVETLSSVASVTRFDLAPAGSVRLEIGAAEELTQIGRQPKFGEKFVAMC
jgi:hypothetical protein